MQAFELSQFIKGTTDGADISILCGDLNLEPVDMGYRLILSNARMKDVWVEAKTDDQTEADACTCDVPANIYTSAAAAEAYPQGKRIDYILYNYKRGQRFSEAVYLFSLQVAC